MRFGLRRRRDPEVGALVITATAFAVVLPITAAAGQLSDLSDLELWPFFVIGLLVPGLSQILFTEAVRRTGASRTAILIGTGPLFSALLAVSLLGEPVHAGLVVGTLLVVAGGMALARERARPEDWHVLGAVLAVACAALFGVRDNVVRWASEDSDPPILAATTVTLLAATLFTLGWVVARRRAGLGAELRQSTRAFAPAGVALGLAYASIVAALDRGPVTVVAPLNATQSLWGVVFAALLIGSAEMIGRRTVLASVLVVAGAVIIGATR